MSFAFAALPWLPEPPVDFTARRRALAHAPAATFWAEAQRLAGFRLGPAQAAALGREMARRLATGDGSAPLARFRLAVLAGSTTELLAEGFAAAAARHGVALELVAAGFDQVEQAALDPGGPIAAAAPDGTLLAVDHRWLRLDRPRLHAGADAVEAALSRLSAVLAGLKSNGGGVPILCTAPTPPETLFGSLDVGEPGSIAAMIAAFNIRLPSLAKSAGGVVLDVAGLAARVGADEWFDAAAYHQAKLAFAPTFDGAYSEILGRLIGALRGRARKALVLDLDNTLWGGVLGDDGLEGLRVGPGDPLGEAFSAVQTFVQDLQRRGVFLAVSSKNEDGHARRAFATLSGMALCLDDIAVFQANWREKPENLAAIAETLNIGVDALVLLDDNAAERARTRAALPGVAVPDLPSDPSLYPRILAAAGYFEATVFSTEDSTRAAQGKAEALRAEVLERPGDLGDYLAGLGMRLSLAPFDPAGRARIAQLINKTNQFNLTVRRRTEPELAALEGDPSFVTLQARLKDRFGDLGMIAVLIAQDATHAGEPASQIDTWLMSCRVLGRGVEEAMFERLTQTCRRRGARWLVGRYRPTGKNGPIADLLPRLGFEPIGDSGGDAIYRLDLVTAMSPATSIRVD